MRRGRPSLSEPRPVFVCAQASLATPSLWACYYLTAAPTAGIYNPSLWSQSWGGRESLEPDSLLGRRESLEPDSLLGRRESLEPASLLGREGVSGASLSPGEEGVSGASLSPGGGGSLWLARLDTNPLLLASTHVHAEM